MAGILHLLRKSLRTARSIMVREPRHDEETRVDTQRLPGAQSVRACSTIPARSQLVSMMFRLFAIFSIVAPLVLAPGHARAHQIDQSFGGLTNAAPFEMVAVSADALQDADGCNLTDGHCCLCPCCSSSSGPVANLVQSGMAFHRRDAASSVLPRDVDLLRSILLKRDPPRFPDKLSDQDGRTSAP